MIECHSFFFPFILVVPPLHYYLRRQRGKQTTRNRWIIPGEHHFIDEFHVCNLPRVCGRLISLYTNKRSWRHDATVAPILTERMSGRFPSLEFGSCAGAVHIPRAVTARLSTPRVALSLSCALTYFHENVLWLPYNRPDNLLHALRTFCICPTRQSVHESTAAL